MNRNYLLKVGVLVISLLLVGGFVAYRARGFDSTTRRDDARPATPAMMSDSKTGVISNPQLQGSTLP